MISLSEEFPVNKEYVHVKRGITLYKSSRAWVALIKTEDGKIRLYKWEMRKGAWKVGLARFNIDFYAEKLIDALQELMKNEQENLD